VKVLVLTAFGDGESLQLPGSRRQRASRSDRSAAPDRRRHPQRRARPPGVSSSARGRRGSTAAQDPLGSLSDRESEFLALVAEGVTNTRIAERLSVSEHTVKFHLQNIFQKLGVANRTEAARLFLQRQLAR
jgi:DNA-binding NarL/FixJ family response regulator